MTTVTVTDSNTDRQDFYFGWVSESNIRDDPERFDIGWSSQPLPTGIVSEFEEIISLFGNIRPTLIDFITLKYAYIGLLELPVELVSLYENRPVVLDVGSRTIRSHVLAETRLSNFLNGASSFRDRTLVRLREDATIQAAARTKLSSLFDRSFGYRVCYALRNFSQHHSHPLHIIPVNATRPHGGNLEYKIDLEIERDRLLDPDAKLSAKLRAELSRMPEKIPLMPIAAEYYVALREFFLGYLALHGSGIQLALGYELAVRRAVPNMPKDASPLLFRGKPIQVDGQTKCNVTSFSFDELAILRELIMEVENEQ